MPTSYRLLTVMGLAMMTATGLAVAPAHATTVVIQSTDAIWNYAGVAVAGTGSTTPVITTFAAGPNQVLKFSSVTGAVSLTPGYSYGPDGGVSCPPGACPLNVLGAAGLSGIISGNAAFLAGVFLNGAEAASHVVPATLSFSTFNFASLAPATDQVFFIGDGLTGTGTGAQQSFIVPTDATELVLAIADANGYSGVPGAYFDNSGIGFTAQFAITAPTVAPITTPEPASYAVLLTGLVSLLGVTRLRMRNTL